MDALIEFIMGIIPADKLVLVTGVVSILFVVSEVLASNEKIAANSVFQLVKAGLGKLKDALLGKKA